MPKRPVRPLTRGVNDIRVTHPARDLSQEEHIHISHNDATRQETYPHINNSANIYAEPAVIISVHALLRWAERRWGVDLDAVRRIVADSGQTVLSEGV